MSPRLASIKPPEQLTRLAYESLRKSILNGHMRSGELLTEMKLAEELGISRTPVREALLELASQGLVEILPRKGIKIKDFSEQDVHEVFQIREIIEIAAIDIILSQGPVGAKSNLNTWLDKQRLAIEEGDQLEFLEADRMFHNTFCEMTGNARLPAMLDHLRDLVQVMGVEALTREGRLAEVMEEHTNILRFIFQGNAEEAKAAMRLHLLRSKEAVLEQHPRTEIRE